jgi:hypothetical protein
MVKGRMAYVWGLKIASKLSSIQRQINFPEL